MNYEKIIETSVIYLPFSMIWVYPKILLYQDQILIVYTLFISANCIWLKTRTKSKLRIEKYKYTPLFTLMFYVLISCLNYSATYDDGFKILEYNETKIPYLPTTYNIAQTKTGFFQLLFLISLILYTNKWLLFKQQDDSKHFFDSYVKKCFICLFINGVLCSCLGLLDRMELSLPFVDNLYDFKFNIKDRNFGPFGYGGNAGAFLILSIFVGLFLWNINSENSKCKQTNYQNLIFIGICIQVIGLFLTYSRLAIISFIICILFKLTYFATKNRFFYFSCFSVIFSLLFCIAFSEICIAKARDILGVNNWIQFAENTKSRESFYNAKIKYLGNISEIGKLEKIFTITDSVNEKYGTSSISLFLRNDSSVIIEIFNRIQQETFDNIIGNIDNYKTESGLFFDIRIYNDHLQIINKQGNVKKIFFGDFKFVKTELYCRAWFFKEPGFLDGFSEISLNYVRSNRKSRKISNYSSNDYFSMLNSIDFTGRDILWLNSIEMLKDHWLFGCGYKTWGTVYLSYRDPGQIWESWAHSDPLQICIEVGVVGSILIILFLFKASFIGRQSDLKLEFMWVKLGLWCVFIVSLFDFPFQYFPLFLIFIFLFIITRTQEFKHDDKRI